MYEGLKVTGFSLCLQRLKHPRNENENKTIANVKIKQRKKMYVIREWNEIESQQDDDSLLSKQKINVIMVKNQRQFAMKF